MQENKSECFFLNTVYRDPFAANEFRIVNILLRQKQVLINYQ